MRLQTKLVGAFVIVALPGIAASVAAVRLFDQVITDEIDSRTREVVAETRLLLESELSDIAERVEAVARSSDPTLAALAEPDRDPIGNERGEDWAPAAASSRRLDVLAVAIQEPDGSFALASSAHLPAAVGDPPTVDLVALPAGETRTGLILEMVEGNPPRHVAALVAMHAPSAFGGRLFIYGGRRLDARLLGRVARIGQAHLVLKVDRFIAHFPEAPDVSFGGKPDALTLPRLGAGAPGRLEVSVNNLRMWSARGRFMWLAQITAIAALVLGLAGGLVLAGRMAQPVRALSSAAERVGAGDLEVQVAPTSRDEVGTLVKVFNRMTRDLRDARVRIQQAERVAAWREVARQLAHEIRNPLSPMRLGMENLRKAWSKKHPRLEEILEESTRSVLEEVSALDRLVTSFSTFAQLPAPDPEPTPPVELLEAAARLYDARVEVEGPVDEDLPEVAADRDLIGRALVNAIKNALEAGAGRVTLRAARADEAGRLGVRIEVNDDGPGMSAEILERAGSLHFTTKARGSGMGLAVVKRTLEDHGGALHISSQPGAGTCIQMWLPDSEIALSDVRH